MKRELLTEQTILAETPIGRDILSKVLNTLELEYEDVMKDANIGSFIFRTATRWSNIYMSMIEEYDAKYCILDDFKKDGDLSSSAAGTIYPFINNMIIDILATQKNYPMEDIKQKFQIFYEQQSTEYFALLNNMCVGRVVKSRELETFRMSTLTDDQELEIEVEKKELIKSNSVIIFNEQKDKAYKVTLSPEEMRIYNDTDFKVKKPLLIEINNRIESGEIDIYTSLSVELELKCAKLRKEEHLWSSEI